MSQGAIPLTSGGGGSAVRGYINAAIARLQTKASGTARPSDIAAGEDWIETDNPGSGVWSLWRYDGTTDSLLGTIDSTAHTFKIAAAALKGILTTQGDVMYHDATGPTRLAAGSHAYKALFTGGSGANPAWAGALKVIGSFYDNGTPVSSVDFTGIPAGVYHIMMFYEVKPGTNAVDFFLQTFGADGVRDVGVGDYEIFGLGWNDGNTSGVSTAGAGTILLNYPSITVSNAASNGFGGFLTISGIQDATYTKVNIQSQYLSSASAPLIGVMGAGIRIEADRITGIRFAVSSGTFAGRVVVLALAD